MPTKKNTPTKLAARLKEVNEAIKALTEEKAKLTEALLSNDTSQSYAGDGIVLSFTPVRTLDSTYIAKKFPATKRPEFYKLSLDTAEVKKHFAPNELETMQKVSYRINVKEA